MVNSKKIYFAHPIKTYNTDLETELIAKIKEKFPTAEITNPKDIRSHNFKDFYSVIAGCDLIIFYGYSIGVISEIYFAKLVQIPIIDAETMTDVTAEKRNGLFTAYEQNNYFSKDIQKMQEVIEQ